MFDMKYSSKQSSPYKHFFICVMAACVILALILLVAATQTETEHAQAATAMILAVAVVLLFPAPSAGIAPGREAASEKPRQEAGNVFSRFAE